MICITKPLISLLHIVCYCKISNNSYSSLLFFPRQGRVFHNQLIGLIVCHLTLTVSMLWIVSLRSLKCNKYTKITLTIVLPQLCSHLSVHTTVSQLGEYSEISRNKKAASRTEAGSCPATSSLSMRQYPLGWHSFYVFYKLSWQGGPSGPGNRTHNFKTKDLPVDVPIFAINWV